jgi:hypothetical protein
MHLLAINSGWGRGNRSSISASSWCGGNMIGYVVVGGSDEWVWKPQTMASVRHCAK